MFTQFRQAICNIRFLDPAVTNAYFINKPDGKTELQIVSTENSNISLPVDQLKPGIICKDETKSSISNKSNNREITN